MDVTDHDDHDQHPDFRILLNDSKRHDSLQQALPSRDTKTAPDAASVLEEQYDAYFGILAEERHAAERTFSRAVYEPEQGLFRLTVNRGTHFVSMGHTIHGQIYLYPEEALYLVDRGSLLVTDRDGCNNMSVQQVWSIYLSQAPALQSPQRGIVEHEHEQEQEQEQDQEQEQEQEQGRGRGDPMAMPRYLAYAYLKRLGFIVIRPGTYIPEVERRVGRHSNPPILSTETRIVSRLMPAIVNWWSSLWSSVFGIWERRLGTVLVGVGLRLGGMWTSRSNRPLVANNVQLHYDQILQRLQIIPSMRLVQRPNVGSQDAVAAATNLGSSSTESKDADTMKRRDSVVDFEVYKPAGAFKKRQPGPPDYRVVVTSPNTSLPTLDELSVLMHGQSDPDQEMSSNAATAVPEKGKKKKAPDWPNVLFAVVDGGQVSFMNISNIKVIP